MELAKINGYNGTDLHWKKFLNAIEYFTDTSASYRMLSEIYQAGLSVYSFLPNFLSSSLFIMSESSFDFEQKLALPHNQEHEANHLYDYLIDNGHIGIALEYGKIISVNINSYDDNDKGVLIIPLRKSRGINGIILVVHTNSTEDFNQFLIKLCNVFASLLGSTIENHLFLNEIEQAKSILEQKIATRTLDLAQSRREMKAIFDSVLTGVLVFDMSISKIVRVNPVACDMIGLTDSDIVGRSTFDFLGFKNYAEIRESNGSTVQQYYDSELKINSGKVLQILRNTTKLRLNNRVLITESFIDISKIKEAELALTKTNELLELKVRERTEELTLIVHKLKQEIAEREKAEEELRRLYEHQKELADLKTSFVSMVSHEFRTPLTIIKSAAQMMRKFDKKLDISEKDYYIQRILKSVDNLTDLIENVVFIGKTDSENITVNEDNIDIASMIEDTILDFKTGPNEDRNYLIYIKDNLQQINTDETLLHLVLTNLISNATKYSSVENDIIISVDFLDSKLIVSVKDFGIGIPDSEQEMVFDLFFRAKNVAGMSGTGLGLAVVKESLNKLGGTIEMKSKINVGSEFIVSIPIMSQEIGV